MRLETGHALDVAKLRANLRMLKSSCDVMEATAQLNNFTANIGSARVAWAPDLSRPYFDHAMDDFNRRQGWPEEIMRLWWDDHATIKMPLYIRCRTARLPFVTDLTTPIQAGRGGGRHPVLRQTTAMTRALGIESLVTVPIHLPKGQVALMSWAFNFGAERAKDTLSEVEAELIAAAHFFMNIFLFGIESSPSPRPDVFRLTPREWETLRLSAQGFREREVAELSGISETTVRFHVNNVVKKLGATTKLHAIVMAAQMGLLGPIGR